MQRDLQHVTRLRGDPHDPRPARQPIGLLGPDHEERATRAQLGEDHEALRMATRVPDSQIARGMDPVQRDGLHPETLDREARIGIENADPEPPELAEAELQPSRAPRVAGARVLLLAAGGGGDLIGLAIGLGIGIAVFGGALGQGKIGAAFQEGVSRNPGASKVLFTPLILSLVFVETLVLFTVLIMFILQGKI